MLFKGLNTTTQQCIACLHVTLVTVWQLKKWFYSSSQSVPFFAIPSGFLLQPILSFWTSICFVPIQQFYIKIAIYAKYMANLDYPNATMAQWVQVKYLSTVQQYYSGFQVAHVQWIFCPYAITWAKFDVVNVGSES